MIPFKLAFLKMSSEVRSAAEYVLLNRLHVAVFMGLSVRPLEMDVSYNRSLAFDDHFSFSIHSRKLPMVL